MDKCSTETDCNNPTQRLVGAWNEWKTLCKIRQSQIESGSCSCSSSNRRTNRVLIIHAAIDEGNGCNGSAPANSFNFDDGPLPARRCQQIANGIASSSGIDRHIGKLSTVDIGPNTDIERIGSGSR